jgi:hypothetical protein
MLYITIFGKVDSAHITDFQMCSILIKMKTDLADCIKYFKMLKERLPEDAFNYFVATGKFIYSTSNNWHSNLYSQFEEKFKSYNWLAKIINEKQIKRSDFSESSFRN